jgi:hypothetical protein
MIHHQRRYITQTLRCRRDPNAGGVSALTYAEHLDFAWSIANRFDIVRRNWDRPGER